MIESFDGVYEVDIDSVHLYGDNNNRETLGSFAEDLDGYWYIITYIPVVLAMVASIGYFIERKLVIRKLSRPK